jgi:hypothetical protein
MSPLLPTLVALAEPLADTTPAARRDDQVRRVPPLATDQRAVDEGILGAAVGP